MFDLVGQLMKENSRICHKAAEEIDRLRRELAQSNQQVSNMRTNSTERLEVHGRMQSDITRLVSEKNMVTLDLERAQARLEAIRGIIRRDHSATRFSEICAIMDKAPESNLLELKVGAVEDFCAWLKSDRFLDKTTYDGAIEYTGQLREKA